MSSPEVPVPRQRMRVFTVFQNRRNLLTCQPQLYIFREEGGVL
jgi:hypothetical protein